MEGIEQRCHAHQQVALVDTAEAAVQQNDTETDQAQGGSGKILKPREFPPDQNIHKGHKYNVGPHDKGGTEVAVNRTPWAKKK